MAFTVTLNDIENYKVGIVSTKDLSKKYNKSVKTIQRALSVYFPNRKVGAQPLSVDSYAFSSITEESAYWIGFLMADGSVDDTRVRLGISIKDIEHLMKYKNFLKSEHSIWYDSKQCCHLDIRNQQLVNDLTKHGVVPNKTYTASTSEELSMSPNFWRGVIDGDGGVYTRQQNNRPLSKHIVLVGSELLMNQYLNFVKQYVPTCKASVRKSGSIYRVETGGGPNYEPIFLTLKGEPCLNRKWEKV